MGADQDVYTPETPGSVREERPRNVFMNLANPFRSNIDVFWIGGYNLLDLSGNSNCKDFINLGVGL